MDLESIWMPLSGPGPRQGSSDHSSTSPTQSKHQNERPGLKCHLGKAVPQTGKPWLALALTFGAALAYACPNLTQWLAFDTEASRLGEIWRILTGHFCHYNESHFIGDVGAFLIWAIVVELVSRRLLLGAISVTIALVG